jgi:C4-type Zn-finger protein
MAYTIDQRQRIVQWIAQRVPRLTEYGCPLCAGPATAFGVEQIAVPNLEVPLMAIACRTCGYIMLFNEAMILGEAAAEH